MQNKSMTGQTNDDIIVITRKKLIARSGIREIVGEYLKRRWGL
jgi:hypothetical protein